MGDCLSLVLVHLGQTAKQDGGKKLGKTKQLQQEMA